MRAVIHVAMFLAVLVGAAAPAASQSRAQALRDTFRQAVPAVRRCFERSLRSGEDPRGPFVLEVHVERSGRVSHARFEGAEAVAPRFSRCATHALKRLRFPPQPERVVIRYPLNVDVAQ